MKHHSPHQLKEKSISVPIQNQIEAAKQEQDQLAAEKARIEARWASIIETLLCSVPLVAILFEHLAGASPACCPEKLHRSNLPFLLKVCLWSCLSKKLCKFIHEDIELVINGSAMSNKPPCTYNTLFLFWIVLFAVCASPAVAARGKTS